MKRVLHLLASNKFSGAENVVCTIIDNFKYEYDMAYCSPNGEIKDTLKYRKIKYLELEKFSIRQLKKIISEYNPDIIHAHDYRASILVAFSGFKGDIISHIHINATFAKKWNIKSFLYYILTKKYYKIVGVSDSVLNEMIFKNKIKNKYITIYNYVDKDKILDMSEEYSTDEKYDLLFFGRLNLLKNPIEFIEIVKNIKEIKNDIKAVMIGNGKLYNLCQNKIKEYNMEQNITLKGFLTNPFPIIKNCKICVMPSKVEGFGLTAIEAMILGKPVFNSGVGGLSEIFCNNKEFICDNISTYTKHIININEYVNNNCYNSIITKYTNIEYWKKYYKNIYN